MKCDFASTNVHIHASTKIKITIPRIDDPLCKDEPFFFWEIKRAYTNSSNIQK
jgi:hypothetical protein